MRARALRVETRSRVGASMTESRPSAAVGGPGSVDLVGDGGFVADVDPAVIEVEAQPGRVAQAQREGRGAFGAVGEALQLGEGDDADLLGDVAQHTAGGDGSQLLIVTDEPARCRRGTRCSRRPGPGRRCRPCPPRR